MLYEAEIVLEIHFVSIRRIEFSYVRDTVSSFLRNFQYYRLCSIEWWNDRKMMGMQQPWHNWGTIPTFAKRNDENHEKLQWGWMVFRLRFVLSTPQIQVWDTVDRPACSVTLCPRGFMIDMIQSLTDPQWNHLTSPLGNSCSPCLDNSKFVTNENYILQYL